jgi:hypothetical protein
MDVVEFGVVVPARQVTCTMLFGFLALWRPVLAQLAFGSPVLRTYIAPLTASRTPPCAPAPLSRRDQRPLLISQIKRATRPIAVVAGAFSVVHIAATLAI